MALPVALALLPLVRLALAVWCLVVLLLVPGRCCPRLWAVEALLGAGVEAGAEEVLQVLPLLVAVLSQ